MVKRRSFRPGDLSSGSDSTVRGKSYRKTPLQPSSPVSDLPSSSEKKQAIRSPSYNIAEMEEDFPDKVTPTIKNILKKYLRLFFERTKMFNNH